MTGGLIQLVAYGDQDLFLSSDPQITFFKIVYRRHTNFSTEIIKQPFVGNPEFGRRITCILSRNGDLIRKLYLVAVLPMIPQFVDENGNIDVITKFAWVRRVGFALIKNIEIELGGELIDRQYGDWLNIWYELTVTRQKHIPKLIGDVKELVEYTNGKPSYKLYIPLQFWFNRFAGLAIPLVALQYNHVKLNIEFNNFDSLYTLAPTHYINIENDFVNFQQYEYIEQHVDGFTSLAQFVHFDIMNKRLYLRRITDNRFKSPCEDTLCFDKYVIKGLCSKFEAIPCIDAIEKNDQNRNLNLKNISLKESYILAEYIFLDDEERIRFTQARHEYLIEQLQYEGEQTIDGMHQKFKIGFSQPTKEIIFVSQLTEALNTRINQHFNYTDSLLTNCCGEYIGRNILTKASIIFNGQERVSYRDISYYSDVQIYQNHTHGPREGINVYSFSINPEKHQPSGAANLTQIDNIRLRIETVPKINICRTAKLRTYCLSYNVLRIATGISGLVFTNDG